jgi:DNA-binding GntR family transcriptional regulator
MKSTGASAPVPEKEAAAVVLSLKPVDRPRALGDQVYQALRDTLRNGSIAAGSALQVTQLAEQLGVSRTPVRDALTRLAGEGVLVSEGGSFILPAFGIQDMDDLYEVRFLIEPAAIRSVADSTNDPNVRRPIEEALADAVAAHAVGHTEAFREANRQFRAAWLALVPNRPLVKAVEQYADNTQQIRVLTLGSPEVRSIVLDGLARIAGALEAGDGEAAAAAMHDHLTQSKRIFIGALRVNGSVSNPKPE